MSRLKKKTPAKSKTGRIKINSFPTFIPRKYGQVSTGAPSVERLNPPAGGSTNPPA
jgi:hypothetical protein